jgi:hypothetical protein
MADHLVMLLDGTAVEGAPRALLRADARVAEFFAEPAAAAAGGGG